MIVRSSSDIIKINSQSFMSKEEFHMSAPSFVQKIKNAVIDIGRDVIEREKEEAIFHAINSDIDKAIKTLYEAGVSDENIINLVHKYWGISREEILERYACAKKSVALKSLCEYLKSINYSDKKIDEFIRTNNIRQQLKDPNFWPLWKKPEKLHKALIIK